jgi:hypothetical protein
MWMGKDPLRHLAPDDSRNAVISGARLSAECVAIVSVTARSVQRISALRATQQKD